MRIKTTNSRTCCVRVPRDSMVKVFRPISDYFGEGWDSNLQTYRSSLKMVDASKTLHSLRWFEGNVTRSTHLMGKKIASCRCSIEPIHWSIPIEPCSLAKTTGWFHSGQDAYGSTLGRPNTAKKISTSSPINLRVWPIPIFDLVDHTSGRCWLEEKSGLKQTVYDHLNSRVEHKLASAQESPTNEHDSQ